MLLGNKDLKYSYVSIVPKSPVQITRLNFPLFEFNISWTSFGIESILLGIPIPSIFVAQRDDGVWDVIDGLQRLSTIFQLI